MSAAPLNPFASQTVSSLRKIEPPLRWLNDAALRKLIAIFELVEEKPHRCELVQPVLSKGDGYGKSHLLGRLVHEVDGRATCVSVAPYHDPLTCWVTLLQSMLSELSQPELIHHLPYPPTALDELAHQLFGFLTVMLADKGMTDTPIPGGLRDEILAGAFEKWDLSDPASPLGVWVNETLSACEQDAAKEAILVRLLKAATLHPYNDDASAMNWLLVLHRYAGDRTDEDSRQMCLEWILTNQLEIPAESFLQNDEQLAGNNLIARQQTLDLLALAKLHRPFLLCFDQIHGLTSTLAKSFGHMLMDLVRAEGAHFSIVTANSNHWETTVLPEFGPDSLPCLATKMDLAGLTREQGRSLAEQRLQSNGDPVELQERFLKKDWLQEQFAQGLLGQREFLRRCQARYQELVPEAINPPDDAETPEAETLPLAPLLDDDRSTIPAPDFNVTGEMATAIATKQVITEALPPLPVMEISELAPKKSELILEVPAESPSASSEPDQISTPPVVEAPLKEQDTVDTTSQFSTPPVVETSAPAEITNTISEASAAPVEAPLKEQDTDDTTSQISTPPVVETPVPAEITNTISEASTAPLEAPLKEQNTDDTTSQISTPPVIEPPTPAEITNTIVESNAAPVEAPLKEQDTVDTTSQTSIPPVVETPTPAEITNTISESNAAPLEAPIKEQDAVDTVSEPSSSIKEVSTPEIAAGASPYSAPSTLEEAPPASESSTLIPLLPNHFSAFTPLVDIIAHQTEDGKGSNLPSVLLPPAQEDFLSEPNESSEIPDAEKTAPSLQELASSLAEPEKIASEETLPAFASSVIETKVSVPTELEAKTPTAAEEAVVKETAPETENSILESLPVSESAQETIPELSTENSGLIPQAPLLDEVETTTSSALPVTDETSVFPAPDVPTPLPNEIEPKNLEAEPDTTTASEDRSAAEPSDIVPASVISHANEPDPTPVEVSTPALEAASDSMIAATVAVNDQAELRETLLNIIKAHRFASHIAIADELRRKMQRSVSAEETVLCAQTISEIHVYADGPNVAFLWQGVD